MGVQPSRVSPVTGPNVSFERRNIRRPFKTSTDALIATLRRRKSDTALVRSTANFPLVPFPGVIFASPDDGTFLRLQKCM